MEELRLQRLGEDLGGASCPGKLAVHSVQHHERCSTRADVFFFEAKLGRDSQGIDWSGNLGNAMGERRRLRQLQFYGAGDPVVADGLSERGGSVIASLDSVEEDELLAPQGHPVMYDNPVQYEEEQSENAHTGDGYQTAAHDEEHPPTHAHHFEFDDSTGPDYFGTLDERAHRKRCILRDYFRARCVYFKFRHTYHDAHPVACHYQLRHLIEVPTDNCVVYVGIPHDHTRVECLNIHSAKSTVLDVGASLDGYYCTCSAKEGFLAVGELSSRVTVASLKENDFGDLCVERKCFSKNVSDPEVQRLPINYVEVVKNRYGPEAVSVLGTNNAGDVYEFSIQDGKTLMCLHTDVALNKCALSPDSKLLCLVADAKTIPVFDVRIKEMALTLMGHCNHNFAATWHKDGLLLATGGIDRTCRIWDIRNTVEPLKVLFSPTGPVWNAAFSPDGNILGFCEPQDSMHL